MTDSYPKTEIDLKLKAEQVARETLSREVYGELKQHRHAHTQIYNAITELKEYVEHGFDKTNAKQDYTNSKVKKTIIALTAIGAFALGTGLQNITTLLNFII